LAEKDAWVRTFDQSFDDPVRPELERIEAEERDGEYAHNPRLVEPLLGEIAALIDRCLAYRREGAGKGRSWSWKG
jgi:hypothetical protein